MNDESKTCIQFSNGMYDVIFGYLLDDRGTLVALARTNHYHYRQFQKQIIQLNHHLYTALAPLYRTELAKLREIFIQSVLDNITVRTVSHNFNLLTHFHEDYILPDSVYRSSAKIDAFVQLLNFFMNFMKPRKRGSFYRYLQRLPIAYHTNCFFNRPYLTFGTNNYNIPAGNLCTEGYQPRVNLSINLPLLFEVSWVARAPSFEFARYHLFFLPLEASISRGTNSDSDYINFNCHSHHVHLRLHVRYNLRTQQFFVYSMTIHGEAQNHKRIRLRGFIYLHSFRLKKYQN